MQVRLAVQIHEIDPTIDLEELEQHLRPPCVILVENVESANAVQLSLLIEKTRRNPDESNRCMWLLATSLGWNVVTAKADKLRRKKQERFIQSMKPFLLEKLDPELGKRIDGFFPVLPSWHVQRAWAKQRLKRFRVRLFELYECAFCYAIALLFQK